jgi:hypothetical protein
MGDRSNIVVIMSEDEKDRVWLYGHWMGEASVSHAVNGLLSGRTSDAPYLARIIFESMIEKTMGEETGYGISTHMQDNEYPIIVIHPDAPAGPRVWIEDEDGGQQTRQVTPKEFIAAADDAGQELYELIDTIGS